MADQVRQSWQATDLKDKRRANLLAAKLKALLDHLGGVLLVTQLVDFADELVEDWSAELELPVLDDLAYSVIAKRVRYKLD